VKPSGRILDHNLERLLTRCYRPVRPRAEFVAQLERRLAPWLEESEISSTAGRTPHPWRRAWGVVAAAAALILLAQLWSPSGSSDGPRTSAQQVAGLDQILDGGGVALRRSPEDPWRVLEDGAAAVDHEQGFLELATPAAAGARVAGRAGWSAELEAGGRLRIAPAAGGLRLDLLTGVAHLSNGREQRRLEAVDHLLWQGDDFVDAQGLAWTTRSPRPGRDGRRPIENLEQPEPLEQEPQDPDGVAALRGRVLDPGGEAFTGPFTVVLLKEVPLPQVTDPISRSFEGSAPDGEPGTFLWPELAPGRYTVHVAVEGHAMWKRAGCELPTGAELEIEARLEVGGSLRGFVVDAATGLGLPGALVLCEGDLPLQVISLEANHLPAVARAVTTTRADGSFELPHLTPGAHRLRASGPGLAPTWVDVKLDAPVVDGLLFELGPGGSVEGCCRAPDGSPQAGAQVIVSRFSTGTPGSKMTFGQGRTGEDGCYRVENLAPGLYVVLLYTELPSGTAFEPEYRPIAVKDGETVRADFGSETRRARVGGLVRDGSGEPMPFVSVQLWSFTEDGPEWLGETADALGRFEFHGVEPRAYELFAGNADCMIRCEALEVEAGEELELEVSLEGQRIEGRVVDDSTGEGIAYADLFLVEGGSGSPRPRTVGHAFSKADGSLLFENVPAGRYSLLALPDAGPHAWAIVSEVVVDRGLPREPLELRLEPACRATLELTDPQGRPLAGARVRIDSPLGEVFSYPWIGSSGEDGLVELDGLRPGTWRYRVQLPGHGEVEGSLRASPQDPVRRAVVLAPR